MLPLLESNNKVKYFSSNSSKSCFPKWLGILILSIIILSIGYMIGYLVTGLHCKTHLNFNDFNYRLLSKKLQQEVSSKFLLDQLNLYASEIHQMGSDRNMELADFMKKNWQQWGLKSTKIIKYNVNKTVVDVKNPITVRILYRNQTIDNLTTVELNGSLPLYHSYSTPGYAKGKFVFINYGNTKDLKTLDDLNITYCGSAIIPIVRLGYSMRSQKIKNIAKRCGQNKPGGILVYPDPWDFSVDPLDNSSTPYNTPVYPNSWWLPGDAAVFGNLKMISDLQNPELPSLEGIFQTVNFSKMQTPFPVQPISYNDAGKLFRFMKTSVPNHWRNCLPDFLESSEDYEVEMRIQNKIESVSIGNLVGLIPGNLDNDRYIILGNHRDAWVTGASDPVSGTVILQQVAKILGEAYNNGIFKPLRTILFASWDGEEEGLLGSIEFTNQFSSDLLEHCVAYINMDCPIKGNWSFNGRATPLMIGPMLQSAKNVHVNSSTTLFADWLEKFPLLPDKIEPRVKFLGGGSDHIPFAYVLGIPSAYPEYKYRQYLANMPAYHTRYDNIEMMLKFIDPGLKHHDIISKFVLDYIIQLSYSPILPYSNDRLIKLLFDYYPALKTTLESINFIKATNYSDIIWEQLIQLNETNSLFQSRIVSDTKYFDFSKVSKINDILIRLPRLFLTREGLPTRPFLRNILLSTSLSNSYSGSVFTGINDAIDLFSKGKVGKNVVLRQMSLLSNSLREASNLLKGNFLTF